VTKFSDEAVMSAQATLLRFNSMDGSNIERATRLTLDFAQVTGQDAATAATSLGKALEAPGEGMRALVQAGVVLTEGQRRYIDQLTESGRASEAQALVMGELERAIEGAAEAAGGTM